MTIATLEKIHELLKKEVKTRNNELELTRKVYNERQDDLKAIAAATDDMSVAAAKWAVAAAQAAALKEYHRANTGAVHKAHGFNGMDVSLDQIEKPPFQQIK